MLFLLFLGVTSQIKLPDTCTSTGCVALTIDEGPSAYTETILDILDKKGVYATFHFNPSIVGSEFRDIYEMVEDDGHEIGMRTSPKRTYTDDQAYEEVEEDLDQQLNFMNSRTGCKVKYARSPNNGSLPVKNVYDYFVKKGITQTYYSLAPQDDPGDDPVDRIKEFLGPSNPKHDSFIIQLYEQRLERDGNLAEIIDAIKSFNYEIVPLSECLKGYEPGSEIKMDRSGNRMNAAPPGMLLPHLLPLVMYWFL